MFDKDIVFKGTHAEKVLQLTAKFDDKNTIFKRNLDVYFMAPIVGFLYQTKAESNNGNDSTNQKTTKIFASDVIKYADRMLFNYRLIMLLDNKSTIDIEERVDKAFRNYNKSEEDEKTFNQYVLGGIDVIYDKIIRTANSPEEYISNIYDFMEEIDDRYNHTIDSDNIAELCKLAKV